MKLLPFLAVTSLAVALLGPAASLAGEGHDHGDAPRAATGPALPRFAAASELFELVGVLDGRRITLYLDRAADNSPVTEARIELEVGEAKLTAEKHGEDEFEFELPEPPASGVLPITATVTVGDEIDLLAGELDIHADEHDEAPVREISWQGWAPWAGGAGLAGLALFALARRHSAEAGGKRDGVAE